MLSTIIRNRSSALMLPLWKQGHKYRISVSHRDVTVVYALLSGSCSARCWQEATAGATYLKVGRGGRTFPSRDTRAVGGYATAISKVIYPCGHSTSTSRVTIFPLPVEWASTLTWVATVRSPVTSVSTVITSALGLPIDPSNLRRYWIRLVRSAGVPYLRFHDLRHIHATLMLLGGVHPKVVAERLGHSQVGITLDTYSHVLPHLQGQAADRLERLLFAAEDA